MTLVRRWFRTRSNGRSEPTDVKVGSKVGLATPVSIDTSHFFSRTLFFFMQEVSNSSSGNVPPTLPLEIIHKIIRETCELPLRREDRQVVRACAITCKSWLPFARSLLYHSLTIENTRLDVSRTPGTLGPAVLLQRSHLLTFTRSLTVRVIDEFTSTRPIFAQDGSCRYPGCVSIPDFLSLLAHTPRLRSLSLSVFWSRGNQCSFEPLILDWLSSLALSIEVLDFRYGSTLVYDLVRLWPTIRALRVPADYDMSLPERPSTCLRELRLPITSLAAVIEWFLPPPSHHDRSSLRILELYEIPDGGRTLLSAHGPSVTSLTLTRQPASGLADLFTGLEEFVIAGPFWSCPLPTLPKTLMHIRLQVHAFMSDSVLPAITNEVRSLSNLRLISVEEALTTDKHYPSLQEACRAHGVEILVNPIDSSRVVSKPEELHGLKTLIYNYAPHEHPYLAEMDRFPRRYTFADSEFFGAKR